MAFNKDIREKVYSKFDFKCGYCGENIKIKEMQVDHIIPQSEFKYHLNNKYRIPEFLKHLTLSDVDHIDNLMPSCRVCNKWKNNFDLEFFRNEISEQIKRLNNYSSNYRMAKKYGLVEEIKKDIKFYFETKL